MHFSGRCSIALDNCGFAACEDRSTEHTNIIEYATRVVLTTFFVPFVPLVETRLSLRLRLSQYVSKHSLCAFCHGYQRTRGLGVMAYVAEP